MDDLQRLVETEAIKRLKARYFRALDTKDWALLATLLTVNARSVYGDGLYAFEGRDEIMTFLEGALGSEDIVHMHQAHTPEIEIASDTTAHGYWYFEDKVIFNTLEANTDHSPGRTMLIGTGIYHDEYEKVAGEWLISVTGYERIFEYTAPMHPEAILKTRWNR